MTMSDSADDRELGRRFVLLIGLFALALRLAFSVGVPPDWEWGDAGNYERIAINLLAGNGYSTDGIEPTRVRPPTYPLFITAIYGIFGQERYAVVVAQSLLGSLTCLLAGWIASRLFGRTAGWVAGVIAAFYPALIYYDTRMLREGPTAFLLALTIWAALKGRSGEWPRPKAGLLTGCLLATVSLCRPETILFSLPAVVLASGQSLHVRALLRSGLLALLPIVIVWVPWTARNYATFGTLSPVTAGAAAALWFGSRWAASGADDQTPEARATLRAETQTIYDETTESQVERQFFDLFVQDLLNRPGWWTAMVGEKAILFWKNANGVKRTLPKIHPILPIALNMYYYTLLALAILAAIRYRNNATVRIFAGTIILYTAMYAVLHVRNRYRVPLLPIVFVLTSGGAVALFDLLKHAYQTRFNPS
jgi:4-amino-4-deoxy-L-arabinose transferase-like glycosyltransferase